MSIATTNLEAQLANATDEPARARLQAMLDECSAADEVRRIAERRRAGLSDHDEGN